MSEFTQILKTVGTKHQHEYTLLPHQKAPQGRARTAAEPGLMPFLIELAEFRENIKEKDGPMIVGPMANDYRNKANALPRTFGALDLDGVNKEERRAISAMFAGTGVLYPTYSNSIGNAEGLSFWRLFYSFNRPVSPEEYEKVQGALFSLILDNVKGLYAGLKVIGLEKDEFGNIKKDETGKPKKILSEGIAELTESRVIHFANGVIEDKIPLDPSGEGVAQAQYTPAYNTCFYWTDTNGERQVGPGPEFEELSLDADWLLSKYEEQKAKEAEQKAKAEAKARINARIDSAARVVNNPGQPLTAEEEHRPDIDQKIIDALEANGLYKGKDPQQPYGHKIICPWHYNHTKGGEFATFYQSAPGKKWGFKCHHAHCQSQNARDFLAAIGLGDDCLTGEAARKERREAHKVAREAAQMARYSVSAGFEADYPGEIAEARRSEAMAPEPCPFVPLADELDEIDTERAEWIERLDTGIKSINELFDGGIKQRCLVLIAAMAGSGKTALIHQMADNIAREHPVLFYSLEVTKAELTARAYRRIAYSHNTEARELSKKDIEHRLAMSPADPLLSDVKRIYRESAKNFYFRDIDTPTIEWIEHDIARFEKETGQSPVIFVDYLQLLRAEDTRLQDVARINHVANKLKNLAKRLPVIVISSMNRANYQKEDPGQSAFKGSGDLEYSAHAGIVITTEEIGGEKVHNISLVKARDLPPREQPVQMKYIGHAFYFTEIPPSELAYLRDWKEADQVQKKAPMTKQERLKAELEAMKKR